MDDEEIDVEDWPGCSTPDCGNFSVMCGGLTTCWPCGVQTHGEPAMIALFNANHQWTWEEAKRMER